MWRDALILTLFHPDLIPGPIAARSKASRYGMLIYVKLINNYAIINLILYFRLQLIALILITT